MMSDDDSDGQMIFGDLGGLILSDICLTGEKKTPKKASPRKHVPTGDRTRARCVTSAHATACPTAVDSPPFRKQSNYSIYFTKSIVMIKVICIAAVRELSV